MADMKTDLYRAVAEMLGDTCLPRYSKPRDLPYKKEYYFDDDEMASQSIWSALPRKGTSLQSYEDYFVNRPTKDWPRVLMHLTRFHTMGCILSSVVWGSPLVSVPRGEYSPKLQEIVDRYNSERETNKRKEVTREVIQNYFVFHYAGTGWVAYCTPYYDNEDVESFVVDISEDEAWQLAQHFINSEAGFGDVNHLL